MFLMKMGSLYIAVNQEMAQVRYSKYTKEWSEPGGYCSNYRTADYVKPGVAYRFYKTS